MPDSWSWDGVAGRGACFVSRIQFDLCVAALLVGTTLPVPLPFRFAAREGKNPFRFAAREGKNPFRFAAREGRKPLRSTGAVSAETGNG